MSNSEDEVILDRHLMGEGWCRCIECGVKLYSFDLPQGSYYDKTERCPDINECYKKAR